MKENFDLYVFISPDQFSKDPLFSILYRSLDVFVEIKINSSWSKNPHVKSGSIDLRGFMYVYVHTVFTIDNKNFRAIHDKMETRQAINRRVIELDLYIKFEKLSVKTIQ